MNKVNKKKLIRYIWSDLQNYKEKVELCLKDHDGDNATRFDCMRKAVQKIFDELNNGLFDIKTKNTEQRNPVKEQMINHMLDEGMTYEEATAYYKNHYEE